MSYLTQLLKDLSDEDIIKIVTKLGANKYKDTDAAIIFPTICHNKDTDAASMKLYYYKKDKKFHCYTQCNSTFNLYELFEKVYKLKGLEKNKDYFFYQDIIIPITNISNITIKDGFDNFKYTSVIDKYKNKNRRIELHPINEGILNVFTKHYPIEWILEGISTSSMDKYNILFSINQNKIIIPHYDINNNLIGIRGRALNKWEIENGGKYMPVQIENIWYSHPTSLNLYGINLAKDGINKTKKIILFEGEKSVLKYNSLFEINNSVAVCGSNLNKVQIDLIIKNFNVNEIIIAFDKEYNSLDDNDCENYFNKLWDLGRRYINYCNISFIFDRENLLSKKDSPIDCGKDTFEKLFNKRTFIKEK